MTLLQAFLIPNSTSNDYGAYSLFQYSKKQFEAQIGFRYDHRQINAEKIYSLRTFQNLMVLLASYTKKECTPWN